MVHSQVIDRTSVLEQIAFSHDAWIVRFTRIHYSEFPCLRRTWVKPERHDLHLLRLASGKGRICLKLGKVQARVWVSTCPIRVHGSLLCAKRIRGASQHEIPQV